MMQSAPDRPRPGIRTVLLALSLGMLALPIASIVVLRIYESALVRQTETGLISQSAFVAALYRQALHSEASVVVNRDDYGRRLATAQQVAKPGFRLTPEITTDTADSRWRPRPATLDLASSTIDSPAPDTQVDGVADEIAFRAGLRIQNILREAQRTTLAGLRVTDYQGVIIATTGSDLGHSMEPLDEVWNALNGHSVSTLRLRQSVEEQPRYASISRGARLRVYVSTPVLIDDRIVGSVLAMRTPRTLGSALYANRYLLALLATSLLALALLAGLLVSYAIVRPIKELRKQSLRAIEGEPGAMVPLTRPVTRDIEQLSRAVSTMARSLEERANYMRQFASHVSHEFKTPLTAIRGSIELLQDHLGTMTQDEQKRFLSNLDGDARRLEKLVHDLLRLTAQPDGIPEPGSLQDALHEVAATRTEDILLKFDGLDSDLKVGMQLSTQVSVFTSLVDNAFEHGASQVTVHASRQGNLALIQITDDGPGISDSDHDRIFEPFYTTRNKASGHGLGLSLVSSLVKSHRGLIRSRSAETGAHFEVRIPVDARQIPGPTFLNAGVD